MANKEQIYSRYVRRKGTAERVTRWGDLLAGMMDVEGKPEALSDVLVLDLSYANFAGLMAAGFLAEAGAEVIKIEPPEGDPARVVTPFGMNLKGTGLTYLMEARNRLHVTLDLATEMDRARIRKLAARADVLIETYAPGELDGLGLGYRQLKEINPKLIYVAVTPYGHHGTKARQMGRLPWSDLTSQAESGLAAVLGDLPDAPEPQNWPTRAGFYAAGYASAVETAAGTLAALYFQRTTGQGQMIDVATAGAYASCVGFPPTIGYIWKKPRPRYGTLDYGLCPYGFFKCRDGFVAIACFRDQDFRAALKILNRWDLEEEWRFLVDRITDNVDKVKVLNEEIEAAVKDYTYEEIFNRFTRYSVKTAGSKFRGGGLPVTTKMLTTKDVMAVEHWKKRKTFAQVEAANYGLITVPVAGKMSETPLRVKWIKAGLGEDNDYVFNKYGL
ncbi:MAG: CoA transferase [Thermodesulfobacteriota bacterium]